MVVRKLISIGSHFNEKYSLELRLRVIDFYRNNTARECAKKFNMSHGSVMGLLETSRRKGILCASFKDTRSKEKWSFGEDLQMLRMVGILPRKDIAKIVRGVESRHIIKDRMRALNAGTKFLHGMPKSWFDFLLPEKNFGDCFIKTKAGPTFKGNGTFLIIPWVLVETIVFAHKDKVSSTLSYSVCALAQFQRFIFQEDRDWIIVRKLKEMTCLK